MKQNNKIKVTAVTTALIFYSGLSVEAQTKKEGDTLRNKEISEVVLLGSRSTGRVKTDTPVPVDVFKMQNIVTESPQQSISQILNYLVPSFSSTSHTINDGTDHSDPAQLRGLGPDQVLVLLNGKRRHQSSLINTTLTPGRGSVGTDLNAIPAFALDRIEVLRDGASAQYGSDAIAGVINLQLKKSIGFSGQITTGGYLSSVANNHTGGVDGETLSVDLNYGVKIGNNGFINITGSGAFRDPYSRAEEQNGSIYNAYNAIAYRAMQNGVDIESLYRNINNTPNTNSIINTIKQYAGNVGYFDPNYLSQINSANSIADLQGILNRDVSDQELAYRGLKRKDFNMKVGQSKLASGQLYVNTEIPINEEWKFYSFGGFSYRNGQAGGFYRFPNQARTLTSLYPNGFLPEIETNISDYSLAAGVKGKIGDWNVDLSNTFGKNAFYYTINNTENATLGNTSPTEFDAGGMAFSQNTLNLDFSKKFDAFEGLNFAFGGEYRYENYIIQAGSPESYNTYDINGNVINGTTSSLLLNTDFFGNARPGGAQVFPGYRPENAISRKRNSYSAYADAEVDFTKWLLVDGAIRYENYSDFGSTFNYKLAANIKLDKNFKLRFAGSTGFRAPSLAQLYYSATSTLINGGNTTQVATFRNDEQITKSLGIPSLKQEKSKSLSAGFNFTIPQLRLNFSADAYFIRIDDRIVLTDLFYRPDTAGTVQTAFDQANAEAAQFFANAIDTETKGLDLVVTQKNKINAKISIDNSLSFNINKTKQVGSIKSSEQLQSQISSYFSEENRIYFEEAVPRVKANLSHSIRLYGIDVFIRNSYFGKVTDANLLDLNGDGVANEHFVLNDKVVTDLSVGHRFTKQIGLTVGANNIFNIMPTRNPNIETLTAGNQLVYSRQVSQYGIGGRYLFARLDFNF
ncbi:TonB-dependent receptor [Chryseobacterium sp.]|uniref:TonB-dependent receptor plug domain-containing protein n=1 Tax=Chryseobacterium sp. TaxID=1871047 RepID=UPI0025C32A26|nr:TonB-dependent receptor [Chryseobacterium sp.]